MGESRSNSAEPGPGRKQQQAQAATAQYAQHLYGLRPKAIDQKRLAKLTSEQRRQVLDRCKDWDKAPVSREKISDLVFDWKFYPRKSIDYSIVHRYAKALKAGSVFPSVKIGLLAGKKIIVDGMHRIKSRQELELADVDCLVLPFESAAALFAEAVKWNIDHGRPFSGDEVRGCVKRLKEFKFDVKDIVALTHVPAREIYREFAAPIKVLKAPCGKNIYCTKEPNGRELVQFKKALMLIRDVATSGCIPTDDEFFRNLVLQCREALGKVRFYG